MGKTDKTDPYWVKAIRDPHRIIYHGYNCEERTEHTWCSLEQLRPCNVDTYGGKYTGYRNCQYEPSDEALHYASRYCKGAVPRWFRKHVWEAPKRVEEREKLNKAKQEFNATGDTDDIIFEHEQHRHNAHWYWC